MLRAFRVPGAPAPQLPRLVSKGLGWGNPRPFGHAQGWLLDKIVAPLVAEWLKQKLQERNCRNRNAALAVVGDNAALGCALPQFCSEGRESCVALKCH